MYETNPKPESDQTTSRLFRLLVADDGDVNYLAILFEVSLEFIHGQVFWQSSDEDFLIFLRLALNLLIEVSWQCLFQVQLDET